jgi:hypothetical protein
MGDVMSKETGELDPGGLDPLKRKAEELIEEFATFAGNAKRQDQDAGTTLAERSFETWVILKIAGMHVAFETLSEGIEEWASRGRRP